MSRKSATVQRKLSELESELSSVFRLPPHRDSYRKIFRHLNKRFGYISNLLAAEVASTPEKTHQLQEMGVKLAGLEAAFRLWHKYHTYALNKYVEEDSDDDSDGRPDSPQAAAENFSGKEEDRGRRIWGGFGKLCGAFGGGIIAGAVCCMCVVNYFSSFYKHDDIYIIHPT